MTDSHKAHWEGILSKQLKKRKVRRRSGKFLVLLRYFRVFHEAIVFSARSIMDLYVDYSCEYEGETGRFKLTLPNSDSTSIGDVKSAIQEVIQAPLCDQRLFYQERLLTDDSMLLSRLYFREGDCFKLHFLAAVDIKGIKTELSVLKSTAQEIVEVLERQLPHNSRIENDFAGLLRFFHRIRVALENLAADFFHPWKCLKTVSHRHFFVQEGGFDAFLEVFKFSRQLFMNK